MIIKNIKRVQKTDSFYCIRQETIPGISSEDFDKLQSGDTAELAGETLEYLLNMKFVVVVEARQTFKRRSVE